MNTWFKEHHCYIQKLGAQNIIEEIFYLQNLFLPQLHRFTSSRDRRGIMQANTFLLVIFLALRAFMICTSFQHQRSVPPGLCCRTTFSVNDDVIRNHALESHVFKRSTGDAITHCYMKCRDDCRCLSFNFIHNSKEENCELNDVNKEMQPASLQYRFAVDYYDFVREFSQKVLPLVVLCSSLNLSHLSWYKYI